jgi:very-short-patch-repair endonuclease
MIYLKAVKQIIERELGVEVFLEHQFHAKRKWRFDMAIPSLKLAIEIEGAVYSNGRHTRGSGFLKDIEKYNQAALLGWTLLRFTHVKHTNYEIIEFVKKILAQTEGD